jgi:hypothetical protein
MNEHFVNTGVDTISATGNFDSFDPSIVWPDDSQFSFSNVSQMDVEFACYNIKSNAI